MNFPAPDEFDDRIATLPEKPAPHEVLESVVSELEWLYADAPLGSGSRLVALHAALLVYNLEGWSELIPSVGLSLHRRGLLEMRVSRAARRLAGPVAGPVGAKLAMERASVRIEELIHLIDPELRVVQAA